MAIFNDFEDFISGVSLENLFVKELSFKEEQVPASAKKKGSATIESTPDYKALTHKTEQQKLLLDLTINVSAFGEDEDGSSHPMFTAMASLRCYFDVASNFNLEDLKDIKNEPNFVIEHTCRQIYPVARVMLNDALDKSGYRGIHLPWHVPFTELTDEK